MSRGSWMSVKPLYFTHGSLLVSVCTLQRKTHRLLNVANRPGKLLSLSTRAALSVCKSTLRGLSTLTCIAVLRPGPSALKTVTSWDKKSTRSKTEPSYRCSSQKLRMKGPMFRIQADLRFHLAATRCTVKRQEARTKNWTLPLNQCINKSS